MTKPSPCAYGAQGKEVDPESPGAFAKRAGDPPAYWLKRCTRGLDAGSLYNPQSPTFHAAQSRAVHSHTARPQYEWRPASQASFEAYLRFLETGGLVHLRHAERL